MISISTAITANNKKRFKTLTRGAKLVIKKNDSNNIVFLRMTIIQMADLVLVIS